MLALTSCHSKKLPEAAEPVKVFQAIFRNIAMLSLTSGRKQRDESCYMSALHTCSPSSTTLHCVCAAPAR